jgi:hypothetical protein
MQLGAHRRYDSRSCIQIVSNGFAGGCTGTVPTSDELDSPIRFLTDHCHLETRSGVPTRSKLRQFLRLYLRHIRTDSFLKTETFGKHANFLNSED